MMFVGVGAAMSIPHMIGMQAGMKAETRPFHMIGYSVAELIHEASTVFLNLKSFTSFWVRAMLPLLSALAAIYFTSVLYLLIV